MLTIGCFDDEIFFMRSFFFVFLNTFIPHIDIGKRKEREKRRKKHNSLQSQEFRHFMIKVTLIRRTNEDNIHEEDPLNVLKAIKMH